MQTNDSAWQHVIAVTRPALARAPHSLLTEIRESLRVNGVQDAVARHDSGAIYNWVQPLVQLQGVSDAVAFGYADRHGYARWTDFQAELDRQPSCPRLRSHWHFEGCGYRKGAGTCSEPKHLRRCPLPKLPLRKGVLNQAAFGLALFVRDACDGDLVGWIDARLAAADPGDASPDRATRMGTAVLEPLLNVTGVSSKLWNMILADLLLGGDPGRERWVTAGAGMVAIDSLVHNFLHRTGALRRLDAEHPYGPGCYAEGGCASIIDGLARRIDAREFSPDFPACLPRFIQSAIWRFCAEQGLDICNGNRIDNRHRCRNRSCPTFDSCDRHSLRQS